LELEAQLRVRIRVGLGASELLITDSQYAIHGNRVPVLDKAVCMQYAILTEWVDASLNKQFVDKPTRSQSIHKLIDLPTCLTENMGIR